MVINVMSDTSGDDIGVPNNEDRITPNAAGLDTITLELSEILQNKQIVTSFAVKAYCIVVGLNHKYDKKREKYPKQTFKQVK
jgi:hypothetical protein